MLEPEQIQALRELKEDCAKARDIARDQLSKIEDGTSRLFEHLKDGTPVDITDDYAAEKRNLIERMERIIAACEASGA